MVPWYGRAENKMTSEKSSNGEKKKKHESTMYVQEAGQSFWKRTPYDIQLINLKDHGEMLKQFLGGYQNWSTCLDQ